MKKRNDKFKILLSKWYFNYYELEEQKQNYDEYNQKFNEKINNMSENSTNQNLSDSKELEISNDNSQNQSEKLPNNDHENQNINNNDDLEDDEREYLKKIIKKIKLECHPDKTADKERHELIKEINDAERNFDYSFIILAANDLNIKELFIDINIIEKIFKKFYKIKLQKEEEIKNSCAWAWGTADSEEKKKKVEEFVISKNKNNKK